MAYSKEEIEKKFSSILEDLTEGKALRYSLSKASVSSQTFFIWLDDEEKSKRYARAREIRAERLFDEILLIADSQEGDVYENADGVEVVNHDAIQRARLRVDSRKWMAAKMNPGLFGDKVQNNVTIKTEQPLFPDE